LGSFSGVINLLFKTKLAGDSIGGIWALALFFLFVVLKNPFEFVAGLGIVKKNVICIFTKDDVLSPTHWSIDPLCRNNYW